MSDRPSRAGLALVLALLTPGCTTGGEPDVECDPEHPPPLCAAGLETRCTAEGRLETRECEHVCVEPRGCLRCEPNAISCADEHTRAVCSADGAELALEPCGEGRRCLAGRCFDPCGEAAARADYVGCEYWAVPLANPQLGEGFTFAVIVANASTFTAQVVVEGGALAEPLVREVAAGATEGIALPWIDEVSQIAAHERGGRSVLVPGAAYRITSDVPVLVTQWSPLEYRLSHGACGDPLSCYSYTNDASLLLPAHALGRAYHVTSYLPLAFAPPAGGEGEVTMVGRGAFAVVATSPGRTEVAVTASAPLEDPDGGRIEAGETRSFTLEQGAVLELVAAAPRTEEECAPVGRRRQCASAALDPTGTRVEASAPVAVFSGHTCAYVPFDRPACDHLEEQILPDAVLGRRYVVGRLYPFHERPVPNYLRVLSVADDNVVRFDPPIHPEVTLDSGEHVLVEHEEPVIVEGSGPLLVAHLGVGMEHSREAPNDEGDPSLVLVPPVEQWRSTYVFQVPGTYTSAYASIVAPADTTIELDGVPLTTAPVTLGGFAMYDVALDPEASVHRLEASAPVGLTLHGYAAWTSYSHLGGLSVAPLVD